MKTRLLLFSLAVITVTFLGAVPAAAQGTETPTPTQTPTTTPTPQPTPTSPFSGIWSIFPTATPRPTGEGPEEIIPTIAPPATATPCAQCLDPDHVHGPLFRTMVTSTNTLMDGPRAFAMTMGNSFEEEQSNTLGTEVGKRAGELLGAVSSLNTSLGAILPLDVMMVVGVRLVIFLIIAFIGLIGKIKTTLKWW